MTAMQQLIKFIIYVEKANSNEIIDKIQSIYGKANRLLEIEKKQIIDSFEDSFKEDSWIVSGEEYYNEKFESYE